MVINMNEIKIKNFDKIKKCNLIDISSIHTCRDCFEKSVRLKTCEGIMKEVQSVNIGDRLLVYGDKVVTVSNIFTGYNETICRLCCDGFKTCMSGDHPVLSENGKGIAVNKLKVGDKIMAETGGTVKVLSVEKEPYGDIVYNLAFEGESESVYIVADGIYAGDFSAQKELKENKEENEKILKQIKERYKEFFI